LASFDATSAAVPSPVLMSCSACAAKTSPSTMPLGIDRSTPAVMTTKVVPTLTTVRIATFWASWTKLLLCVNSPGARAENAAMIISSAAKVIIVGLRTIARTTDSRGVTGSWMSDAAGFVSVLMASPRWRTRRRWRR
jgi:hypothetical protein